MHPFIDVFGRAIPVYGLLLLVSAAAAWLTLILLSNRKRQFNTNDVSLVFLIGICGGVIGSVTLRPLIKLVEVIISWERYKAIPAGDLLNYMTGEIVFYGGFLGGLIAIVLFCKKFKIQIIPLFDLVVPALALAHAIGRIGCFFGGCCYGIELPYNHLLSIVYPPISLGAPSGVSLLAMPLIEAAFLMALFIVLSLIYIRSKKVGLNATIYLLIYPAGRFVLEFFRGDIIRGNYGLLTTSQFISIAIFIFGILYFIFVKRRGMGRVCD